MLLWWVGGGRLRTCCVGHGYGKVHLDAAPTRHEEEEKKKSEACARSVACCWLVLSVVPLSRLAAACSNQNSFSKCSRNFPLDELDALPTPFTTNATVDPLFSAACCGVAVSWPHFRQSLVVLLPRNWAFSASLSFSQWGVSNLEALDVTLASPFEGRPPRIFLVHLAVLRASKTRSSYRPGTAPHTQTRLPTKAGHSYCGTHSPLLRQGLARIATLTSPPPPHQTHSLLRLASLPKGHHLRRRPPASSLGYSQASRHLKAIDRATCLGLDNHGWSLLSRPEGPSPYAPGTCACRPRSERVGGLVYCLGKDQRPLLGWKHGCVWDRLCPALHVPSPCLPLGHLPFFPLLLPS